MKSTFNLVVVICTCVLLCGCVNKERHGGDAIGNYRVNAHLPSARTNVVLLSDYELAEFRSRVHCVNPDPVAAFLVYRHDEQLGILSTDDALTYLTISIGGLVSAQLEMGKLCMGDSSLTNYATAYYLLSRAANKNCKEAKDQLKILQAKLLKLNINVQDLNK